MAYANPEDQRAYARQHYQRHKALHLQRNTDRKRRIKTEIQRLKDVPCTDCEKRYPYYVMDFDHRPGETKEYEMNKIATSGGRVALQSELAKCDVVCSNCHRIREHDRRTGNSAPEVPRTEAKAA